MAEVHISDVTKSFGATKVIHGISVDIDDGEFVVIVGPSGCGKSTLLRMIAGLETVTSGDIRIGGRVVNKLEPADRNIAMVFQNYALYPHMSVFDNMAYGLKNRGMAKPDIRARVEEAAKTLELQDLLQRRPRQLSGGQRQRVAMGRAIVRQPDVFLFDEPLSNLDAKLRVQMRLEIKDLQRKIGTTSVYVTHDQVEAMTLADRLIVMNAGEAEQIGAPLEVYERPQTTFAAGFIGSPAMNLLDATIEADNQVRLAEDLTVPLNGGNGGLEPGRSVVFGTRPEHVEIAGDGNGATMQVQAVERLGADTLVYARAQSGIAMTMRLTGTERLQPGDTVSIRISPNHLHIFDRETRQRIDH